MFVVAKCCLMAILYVVSVVAVTFTDYVYL